MPNLTEPQLAQDIDPFVSSFAGIDAAAPYPFLGNGYVGYQVPREGQGINGIPPNHAGGLTLIHGVYTGDARPGEFVHTTGLDIGTQPGLAAVPAWSGFAYCCNRQAYSRDIGEHANYQQSLDMRTGTVTTSDTWTLDGNTTELKTTMFISRAHRNRAVIETTITPQFRGEVCFEDTLDGSFCTGCDWEATVEDGVMILAGKIGTRQREVLEASRINFSAGEPAKIEYEETERGIIKRRCFFNVQAGETYIVRKDVGIFTHQDGVDRSELKAKAHAALQQPDSVRLRDEHEQAWASIWQRNIEIPNLPGLQKIINASFYQLVCQLRPDILNSLGPTGITGLLQWVGRAFWDADLWVGHGILPFHPELGQCIAKYRHRTLQGAFYNAHVRHAFLRLYAELEGILPQLLAESAIAQALQRILTESLQRLQEGQAHKGTESEMPLFDAIEEAWRLLENTAESPAQTAVATFRKTYADLLVKRDRIKAGEQNVVDNRYGARFAWESAESGCETWFGVTAKQDHINIAVALFQYQYLLISGDEAYRKQAEEVIIECAKYLASRVTYNEAQDRYEIRRVCGVNEGNGIINNELYTNCGTIKVLEIASAIMGENAPKEWQDIIENMYLPYDVEHDRFKAHDKDKGTNTRQADATLTIFPLECPKIDSEHRRKILDACRERYDIMMGATMDGIGRCEQKQPELAWRELVQTVTDHIEETFCQTREKWHNNTTYFLTGLGGLLQLFIYGFAGLRIRENGFVVNPCIPQQIGNHIVLRGLHHHGVGFDMIVTNQGHVYVSEAGLGIEFTTVTGERIQPYPITEFAPQCPDVVHRLHETLLAQQASKTPIPEVTLQPEAEGGYQLTW